MDAIKRQFTATCYIIEKGSVLLLYHPKLKKWLPPGGHLEENEIAYEAVLREVLEETGLVVELMSDENLWIEEWNADSVPRPYFCLLERVPAHKSEPAHEHMDQVYVGRPIGGALIDDPLVRWFRLDEVLALSEEVIFLETQKAVQHLLQLGEDLFRGKRAQASTSRAGA